MNRIVYLHGFASGPGSKKAQYFARRLLERGVTLEVPDLAEGDFENLTVTRQLQVVERVCGKEAVCLMGSSLGGYLAALYAARHSEVEKLVLMAPAFSFVTRWPKALGAERFEEWKNTGFLAVPHYGTGGEQRVSYRLMEDGRFYEDYPKFFQKALIFHGKNDTVVPPGMSITFSQQHANTTLRLMDSDHELLDVQDAMWAEIQPFLGV
ncbi:MAG TPA: YqiA/YcfP family alpha/beta fold hydrolase [Bryobacteraceae bacterium]|nr:YqiA/YcfP family alpha/beta fold hydrolase [Bryobacteraceae bacterium]